MPFPSPGDLPNPGIKPRFDREMQIKTIMRYQFTLTSVAVIKMTNNKCWCAVGVAGGDHVVAFLRRDGEWLFRDDVEAAVHALDGELGVGVVRRGDA